jgi:hypothetical protein
MSNNSQELFSLGEMYVSDFIKDESDYDGRQKYEMKLLLEKDTGAVRLEKQPPADTMWGKYWYRSGTNQTMKDHLADVVWYCSKTIDLQHGDVWLDIACNDGTLLSMVDSRILKIGIDPADDSFVAESSQVANEIIQGYFSRETYLTSKFADLKPKVITTIAMFYDLENPDSFIQDVHETIHDDGIWVVQMSYTPLMIKQMAFDNICHEHLYYYSLFNIKTLLERNGFDVLNCTLNDANGGSFRVTAVKSSTDKSKFSTQQQRDIFQFNVDSILSNEKTLKLDDPQTWLDFFEKIDKLKIETYNFLYEARLRGERVFGYGASTKGNTLLQYFNIDSSLIEAIVERSPYKYGLKTIGSDIPIISEEQMRKDPPDYMLVLPWHFIDEFVKRESEFLEAGGKFIVPCPQFKIISK